MGGVICDTPTGVTCDTPCSGPAPVIIGVADILSRDVERSMMAATGVRVAVAIHRSVARFALKQRDRKMARMPRIVDLYQLARCQRLAHEPMDGCLGTVAIAHESRHAGAIDVGIFADAIRDNEHQETCRAFCFAMIEHGVNRTVAHPPDS